MGWLEDGKTGVHQICFRFGDERIKRSSRTKDKRKALALLGRIEENLELIQRGRLTVPPDANLFEFLISDGQINGVEPVKQKSLRVGEVFDRYRGSLPPNALSAETLRVAEIHARQAARILGETSNCGPFVETTFSTTSTRGQRNEANETGKSALGPSRRNWQRSEPYGELTRADLKN